MAKHPRMLEAIEKAKIAAASTRGMYPITAASKVFKEDGSALEEVAVESPEQEEPAEDDGDETVG